MFDEVGLGALGAVEEIHGFLCVGAVGAGGRSAGDLFGGGIGVGRLDAGGAAEGDDAEGEPFVHEEGAGQGEEDVAAVGIGG